MKALSLFSGIGGADLAANWAGIESIAFCEREEFCQKVLHKHWSNVPVYDDVFDVTKERLETDGIDTSTIDIIFGGYPCQPFSLAGKQEGEKDERYLWGEFYRIVKEIKPRWVIGENVYGHVNNGLDKVVSDLESSGYETWVFILQAELIGAPHQRERMFVVTCDSNSKPKLQDGKEVSTFGSEWQAWQSFTWKHWREVSELHWSTPEPAVRRVDDGFSKGLDKDRLIALGNAIVPQQMYPIFKAIKEYDKELFRECT